MDIAAVRTEVVNMLATELAIPESRLAPGHKLVDDLHLDSLAAVRLLAAVEERFEVELISTDFVTVQTVQDLVAFVTDQLLRSRIQSST